MALPSHPPGVVPAGPPDIDMQVQPAEFRHIADLLEAQFGIQLLDKQLLVTNRLLRLVRSSGHDSFHSWYQEKMRRPTEATIGELVDRLSTNHTYFWREPEHFKFFRDVVVPDVAASAGRDLRVWCAAAATGEEPYTLALLQRQVLGDDYRSWSAGLLATDISSRALSIARAGRYRADDVARLPPELQGEFRPDGEEFMTVSNDVRADVTYRRFNLLAERMPFRAQFHAVFCRNVMIYFDERIRKTLVQRLCDITAAGGYLVVGHAETIGHGIPNLTYLKPGIYRKVV